jgi:hypothetical protein
MKLLPFVFLLFTYSASSQGLVIQPDKVYFDTVIVIPGLSKEQIKANATVWHSKEFGNENNSVADDFILSNGYWDNNHRADITNNVLLYNNPYQTNTRIEFAVTTHFKDGKTRFVIEQIQSTLYSNGQIQNAIPVERQFTNRRGDLKRNLDTKTERLENILIEVLSGYIESVKGGETPTDDW